MRWTIILFLLFSIGPVSVANNDSTGLHRELKEFSMRSQDNASVMVATSSVDTMHLLARELDSAGTDLLAKLEEFHGVDPQLLLERDLINVSLLEMDPSVSLEYQQRADRAQRALDSMLPPAYAQLRAITSLCRRIQGMRRLEKMRELAAELEMTSLDVELHRQVPATED